MCGYIVKIKKDVMRTRKDMDFTKPAVKKAVKKTFPREV